MPLVESVQVTVEEVRRRIDRVRKWTETAPSGYYATLWAVGSFVAWTLYVFSSPLVGPLLAVRLGFVLGIVTGWVVYFRDPR